MKTRTVSELGKAYGKQRKQKDSPLVKILKESTKKKTTREKK